MTKSKQLAAFGAAAAVTCIASVSAAAPLNHASVTIVRVSAHLVEQVHGTHRACVRGWVPRWGVVRFHRHVGVAHVPVRC